MYLFFINRYPTFAFEFKNILLSLSIYQYIYNIFTRSYLRKKFVIRDPNKAFSKRSHFS